jgi:predicted RND superfamily exporter protein
VKRLLVLGLLTAGTLLYGLPTPQDNSEEIFLSDDARESFTREKAQFGQQDLVVVTGLVAGDGDRLQEAVDALGADYAALPFDRDGSGVFSLPAAGDAQRLTWFQSFERLVPRARFAGGPYVNAQLASMSVYIQTRLFPALFGAVLLLTWLLTGNFLAALELFVGALLGVGVGLSAVRFFFGASNILTTLVPLIGFILTLGMQLHVYYGLAHLSPADFWRLKRRPLALMGGSTLMGFLSLYTSDLSCVRQLAVATVVCLLVTWGVNLWVAWRWAPRHRLRSFRTGGAGAITVRRTAANLFLLALTVGGVVAIARMPVVVEALYFFPPEHPVHAGVAGATRVLGGVPQSELLVSRRDGAGWSYADTQALADFEARHAAPAGLRRVSLASLAREANHAYAGASELPPLEVSYQLLMSRVPRPITESLKSEHGYKWILVGAPSREHSSGGGERELTAIAQQLPPQYQAQLGGRNHWLVNSQAGLVRSLLSSFGLSFAVIVAAFAWVERRWWWVWDFAFLNAASVLGGFAVMGLMGFSLNVSVVMTASIAMGLVVDSTIHLMSCPPGDEATLGATKQAIIVSHIVLFGAFLLLGLETFVPIRAFAWGMLALLGVGLFCDLRILPMLGEGGKNGAK